MRVYQILPDLCTEDENKSHDNKINAGLIIFSQKKKKKLYVRKAHLLHSDPEALVNG